MPAKLEIDEMSVMPDKLAALGYRRLVESDHYAPETLTNLSSIIGRPVPAAFTRFLVDYPNTGTFEQFVHALGLDAAPGVPDKRYAIGVLYSNCSKPHSDLLSIRNNNSKIWDDFLLIGRDDFGYTFAIDLRDGEFGKIKCKTTEQDWDEKLYLVANDFESFILSLQPSDCQLP
ncbi:MAG TPA: SMI1/KNR4 family protein [Verrucomicrobiae bacterium]